MSGTLPTVFTSAGLQPQAPASLNAQLIAIATQLAPGLTILPSGLIDDLASTCTAALVVIDQTRVDLIASFSPNSANPYILNQFGQVYGVPQGVGTNTAVEVVFSGSGIVGYIVQKGFTVSDGTHQYVVQTAGVIGSSGFSLPLPAIATQVGSWAVPTGTVNQLATSVPSDITNPASGQGLGVNNPLAGTPSQGAQTDEDYRSQVTQAGLATSTGAPTLLKTALAQISGVIDTQISVRPQLGGGWEIIVGGTGDPIQIAFAIYSSLFDISTLVGSILAVTSITNSNPAIITTDLNHGYTTGQTAVMNGALGLTMLNNQTLTVTALSPTTFSVPVNTSTGGTYTGGGVMTPNFRNTQASLFDAPDTYTVPYVIPPSQVVTIVITWNTTGSTFISQTAVANAVQPAIAIYVNSLAPGQPMNQFVLNSTFQAAVIGIIPSPSLLTRLVFNVSINGIGVAPEPGTGIIAGDPESFFSTTAAGIVVNQG